MTIWWVWGSPRKTCNTSMEKSTCHSKNRQSWEACPIFLYYHHCILMFVLLLHISGLQYSLNIFADRFQFISIYKFIFPNQFSSFPSTSLSFPINPLKLIFIRLLDSFFDFRYAQVPNVFWKCAPTDLLMTLIVLGQLLLKCASRITMDSLMHIPPSIIWIFQ